MDELERKRRAAGATKRYRDRQKGKVVPLLMKGPTIGTRTKPIQHGTAYEYGKGCRCEGCTRAATIRASRYRINDPEKNRERVKRNQQKNAAMVRDAKRLPCQDCGVEYPYYVMQFDHVKGDKKFGISVCSRRKSKKLLCEEIEKCDVVCANCHMVRTHKRAHPDKA